MNDGYRIYRTGFGGQAFEIRCSSTDAYSIAEFLFLDFPGAEATARQYDIVSSSGPIATLSLWQGDKQLYSGTSRYQLAYMLMNEVIFHCIDTNGSQHALHAGAVSRGGRCIIMPGQSGSGKSTLTGWLIRNGFQYLTDELVFLDSAGEVMPLTRPISLKVGPSHESWLLAGEHGDIICGDEGSMIPHRMLNPHFLPTKPKITDIIFPQHDADAVPGLEEISPAKCSLYLLGSHVNARNHEGHGVSDLASIVRRCRTFTLSYSCFDDLQQIFNPESGLFP